MHVFKDNNGRTWEVVIHATAVQRCRAMLGIDLVELGAKRFAKLGEFLKDDIKLVNVLYVVCKDQADKEKISDEEFGRGMFGDAIYDGAEAFVSALIGFFRHKQIRESLLAVVEKGKLVGTKMLEKLKAKAEQEVATIDVETEAEVLVNKLIASSGNAQESSESTPDLLPCVNSSE